MRFFCLSAVVVLAASYFVGAEASAQRPLTARPEVVVAGKFRGAEGIAFNGEGRLFVTADDALWEVSPDGEVRRVTGLNSAVGLAPIGRRDLIVADFGPTNAVAHGPNRDGVVLRVTPEGKTTVLAKGIGDPNFVLLRKLGTVAAQP